MLPPLLFTPLANYLHRQQGTFAAVLLVRLKCRRGLTPLLGNGIEMMRHLVRHTTAWLHAHTTDAKLLAEISHRGFMNHRIGSEIKWFYTQTRLRGVINTKLFAQARFICTRPTETNTTPGPHIHRIVSLNISKISE